MDAKPECIVCRSNRTLPYPPRYVDGRLWRCEDCGLRFVHPQPSPADAASVYDEDYFRNPDSGDRGYSDYEGDRSNIERSFQRRWSRLRPLCPNSGRVLDVGCAYGFFLNVAAQAGWDTEGIDISPHAVEFARRTHGDRVQQGAFLEAELPEGRFDLITMWDYLEHSLDPKADLVKAHSLLTSGGVLALTTTDAASLPARVMRHRWMGFKVEEHFCFFSRDAMRRVLKDVGFQTRAIRYDGKFITLDLFLQRLGLYVPLANRVVQELVKRKIVPSLSFYANPLDIIMVVAQKSPAVAK